MPNEAQLDPRLFYYLLLYVFIFILRLYKVSRLVRSEPEHYNWKHLGFLSLDIVYASAGLAVLLAVVSDQPWVAVVMVAWSVLLLSATLLDTGAEHLSDNTRLVAHLLVVVSVLTATIVSFQSGLTAEEETTDVPAQELDATYRVAVPYVDSTLDQFIGRGRLGERRFVYTVDVDAPSRRVAAERAINLFWDTSTTDVAPFDTDQEKTVYNLSIAGNAVVELLGE